MVDLDLIERRCKEDSRNGYGKHPVIECASAESIIDLITLLRQAEKDAARYRWLRDTADVDGTADLMISIIVSDEWDSLIDEAMQCK